MKIKKILLMFLTFVFVSMALVSCNNTDVDTDSTKTYIE